MKGFDRDEAIFAIGKMFLATRSGEKPDIDVALDNLPEETPEELRGAISNTLASSMDMGIDWKEVGWTDENAITSMISEKTGINQNIIRESVCMIEEASKIEFADNMPWLGFGPIDPCCGNYCLATGHSGKADTPETLVIPKAVAFRNGDDIDFEPIEDVSSFEDCGFKTLVIPKSVLYINKEFSGCGSFERIIVDERNPRYSSDGQGLLYSKHKTVLCYCPNAKTSITIPRSVTRIDECFKTSDSRLKEIIIEEGNTTFHIDEDGQLCDEDGPVDLYCYDE